MIIKDLNMTRHIVSALGATLDDARIECEHLYIDGFTDTEILAAYDNLDIPTIAAADALALNESLKQAKRDEINLACEQAILGGFTSNALGTVHTYSSSRDDQLNLIGLVSANVPSLYKCTDANGVTAMVQHTALELVQVLQDGATFKSVQLSKARDLKASVDTATDLTTIVW